MHEVIQFNDHLRKLLDADILVSVVTLSNANTSTTVILNDNDLGVLNNAIVKGIGVAYLSDLSEDSRELSFGAKVLSTLCISARMFETKEEFDNIISSLLA